MKSLQKVMRKVKSDMMSDLYAAIIFVIISFVTWLSVLFKLASIIIDENQIFATNKMSVTFYIVNMILACILTITCYELVLVMQNCVKN